MTSSSSSIPADVEWILLYHRPEGRLVKGRGEFLRLMLEDAGVSYYSSGEPFYGPYGMMDMFRGDNVMDVLKTNGVTNMSVDQFPMLYPPAIWHRPKKEEDGGGGGNAEEVCINQVGACMMYIGDQLGYKPKTSLETALATSILMNCTDFITEGRLSFHPIKATMSYNEQKEEGDQSSLEFSKTRLLKYLYHFNKVIMKHGITKPVAGGETVTYADFALFHVLDATLHQFNTEYYHKVWDVQTSTIIPAVKQYHEWMKNRPNLIKYFQSDRCADFWGDSMM